MGPPARGRGEADRDEDEEDRAQGVQKKGEMSGRSTCPMPTASATLRTSLLGPFLDAVAVAMITPGPVVITAGFIGYLVTRLPGSLVAAAATFLPPYLVVILAAPHFKRWGAIPSVRAIIQGI